MHYSNRFFSRKLFTNKQHKAPRPNLQGRRQTCHTICCTSILGTWRTTSCTIGVVVFAMLASSPSNPATPRRPRRFHPWPFAPSACCSRNHGAGARGKFGWPGWLGAGGGLAPNGTGRTVWLCGLKDAAARRPSNPHSGMAARGHVASLGNNSSVACSLHAI